MQKREYLTAIFGGLAVIGASVALFQAQPVVAQTQGSAAVFTSDGKLQIPKGFRRWVFVGALFVEAGGRWRRKANVTPCGLTSSTLTEEKLELVKRQITEETIPMK